MGLCLIKGTLNVLKSACDAGTVTRVVVTSSVAAVITASPENNNRVS